MASGTGSNGDAWMRGEVRAAGERLVYRVRPAPSQAGPNPPAILFLHGRGESGDDNERQLAVGLPRFVDRDPAAWPFTVIAPQKPAFDRLWPDYTAAIVAMLSEVDAAHPSDPSRRYLTGLSQGGNGTLELGRVLPWSFAALAPVCGWANPMRAGRELGGLPIWLFHGSDDDVVPASCSVAVADCLRRHGGDVRLSLYPGVDHNSWDQAYGNEGDGPDLARWLLDQTAARQA